jgi:hypothetical protein
MHFLLIVILLCVVFPVFRHFVGGVLSVVFWLVVVCVVLGLFGVLSR